MPSLSLFKFSVSCVQASTLRVLCGFCWLLISVSATGQSYISLSIGADEQNAKSQSFAYQYRTESRTAFTVYGSQNDDAVLTSDLSRSSIGGGFSTAVNEFVDLGLSVERWGNSGDFTIETVNLQFTVQASQWSLSIEPRLREIKVITGRSLPVLRTLENGISSTGLYGRINYDGLDWMGASAFYSKDRYDWDVTNLDLSTRPRLFQIFSPVTLSLSQGLEDHSYGLDLSLYHSIGLLGLQWSRSRSLVTGNSSNALVVYGSVGVGDHADVGVDLGMQSPDNGSELAFGSVNLGYSW